MKAEEVLADLGLTGTETKAYLALVKLGEAKAGAVIREADLHNSAAHTALASLVKRGLASVYREGSVRYYRASDPRSLIEIAEERTKAVKELVPSILAQMTPVSRHEVELYQGFNGFKAAHYQMLDGVRRGKEWLFFAFYSRDEEALKDVHGFYREFEKERNARGIEVRGLAPKNWAPYYKGRKQQNIKLVSVPLIHNINICADRVIMTPWDDGQISFLLHSEDLAQHFRGYFYSIFDAHAR